MRMEIKMCLNSNLIDDFIMVDNTYRLVYLFVWPTKKRLFASSRHVLLTGVR